MKKEFVVKSIDAAPDGAPYVVISLSSIKDLKEGSPSTQNPFGGPKVMGFSNMNDMMKDLNKTRNAWIQRNGFVCRWQGLSWINQGRKFGNLIFLNCIDILPHVKYSYRANHK